MLSEISQRNTNTTWFHLNIKSKKQNKNRLMKIETKGKFTRGEGIGGWVKKVKENTINKIVMFAWWQMITGIIEVITW